MLFREVKHWEKPHENRGLLFFAQRMEELTFDYSLDSYKASTVNAPWLVKEAIDQLKSHVIDGFGEKSIDYMLEELEDKIYKNPVVSSLASIDLDKYIALDRSNYSIILEKLKVFQRELFPPMYAMKAMELLQVAISKNHKSSIDFLAGELVSTLTNMGMSSSHIYHSTVEYFFGGNIKIRNINDLKPFFELIFPHIHRFKVSFKINNPSEIFRTDNGMLYDINISDSIDDFLPELNKRSRFHKLSEGQKFVSTEDVEAYDVHSAIQIAESRISRVHDLFKIFHHKSTYNLSEDVAVEQCCSPGVRIIKRGQNRMQFVNDFRPEKAGRKLSYILKNTNILRGDGEKFFRVVDFHGMSVSSNILENQILNIWISLETIVPSGSGASKIEHVSSSVLPFIGIGYFKRIVERCLYDLIRWNRPFTTKILRSVECKSGAEFVDRLLLLLALKENEGLLSELLSEMENFEILRFRLFRLSEVFSNPNKLLKKLEDHQRRVSWQIRRIYRTRNAIVHSGSTPKYSGMLVQNAHDYFDQVFFMCCDISCGPAGFYNFKECFLYVKLQYEQYVGRLSKMHSFDAGNVLSVLWARPPVPQRKDFFQSKPTSSTNEEIPAIEAS